MDTDSLLYSFCHHKPDRLLEFLGGHTLLCARCSGIYLGFLVAGIAFLALRRRVGSASLKNLWVAYVLMAVVPLEVAAEVWLGLDPGNYGRYLTGMAFGSGFARVVLVFAEQFFELPTASAGGITRREWLQIAVAFVCTALVVLLWEPAVFNGAVLFGLLAAYVSINFVIARGILGIRSLVWCLIVAFLLTFAEWGLLYWTNNYLKPLG